MTEVFTESEMEQALAVVLSDESDVLSFEDAGLLTRNHGLIIRLENGAEFQITIVKSKSADLEPCEDCGKLTDDIVCEDCAEEY